MRKGATDNKIRNMITVKAVHENGAWTIYWVFGGNSRYLPTGYPAIITPAKGNTISITPIIDNLIMKFLMIYPPCLL